MPEGKKPTPERKSQSSIEASGKKSKCWLLILLTLLLVVLALLALAWKTEYLDTWLPENIKGFLGKEGAEEEGGSAEEGLSLCDGALSKLESLDETWNIYYNCALGFSIHVPKEILVYYGACEWKEDQNSYRPKDALVSTGVFEDNDNGVVYLGHEYYYELAGETQVGCCSYSYSECNEVTNSLSRLNDEYLGLDRGQYQQAWKIVVKTINDDVELDAFIKDRYGEGCSLGEKTLSGDQEGVYNVEIATPPAETLEEAEASGCLINYGTELKYYPAKNKAVSWDTGQACTFFKVLGTGDETDIIYDEQMVDSFDFLE